MTLRIAPVLLAGVLAAACSVGSVASPQPTAREVVPSFVPPTTDAPTSRPTQTPTDAPATPGPTQTEPSMPGPTVGPNETATPAVPFVLTSDAFEEGQPIPPRFTCDGADDQLPLSWMGAPDGTAEFALIQHDPDAGGFVHWVVVGIPADVTALTDPLPGGARHGTNDFGRARYNGPCPPRGNHTYVTTLFALAEPLDLPDAPTARQVRQAVVDITLGQAQLRGTYRRD